MKNFFALRGAALLLALTLPSLCWGFGPAPSRALIVDDGTSFDVNSVETFLSGRLMNAGYTVVTNNGVPVSVTGYKQIWDIRYNNAAALSGPDSTTYMAYLMAGGSLFLMGENSSFLTRDNSILAFIAAAGGGSATVSPTNALNLQTVDAPFTGPVSLTTVTYNAVGAFLTFGSARLVSVDANGQAGGIVFPPGSLTNAPAGTLIAMLDVNFLTTGQGTSPALTDNLIAYLAAPAAITPLAPTGAPAPSTLLLITVGLGGVALWAARRPLRLS